MRLFRAGRPASRNRLKAVDWIRHAARAGTLLLTAIASAAHGEPLSVKEFQDKLQAWKSEGKAPPPLTFEIEGRDSLEPIARGKHVRFIVDTAVTAERLKRKLAKAREAAK